MKKALEHIAQEDVESGLLAFGRQRRTGKEALRTLWQSNGTPIQLFANFCM